PLLKLVVALNLVFLLAFLIMVAMATSRARAEIPACTGINLLEGLEQDDPALLASIRSEAARTPNGSGLLWKIEKEGIAPSYLFGTMHMTDPRVTSLTSDAQSAFDSSSTVVIETTEVLDQSAML